MLKSDLYPANGLFGYSGERDLNSIYTIVVHTTGGNKGSLFENERNFLLHSRRVSAHFLIGKRGEIAQILPVRFIAWHTGPVNDAVYGNRHSIGIECHLTHGEQWTNEMRYTLSLVTAFLVKSIPSIKYIKTHREIAVPKGRKTDPLGFSDEDFNRWALHILANPETHF